MVETDGCSADGVSVATNCWVGRRTLRVEDHGKLAATFVDTQSERAIRLVPRPEVRAAALGYAADARGKWQQQLLGYQHMPAEELLQLDEVELLTPVAEFLSDPGARAICEQCGEEIINAREVVRAGTALCRTCAGDSYYRLRTVDCVGGQAPHDLKAREGRRLTSSVRG
jgi:formylmethanofuran dehydrogenase subunit E